MVDWNTTGYTDKNLEKIKILERNVLDLEKQLQHCRQTNRKLKEIIDEAKHETEELRDRYQDLMKGYEHMERYYRDELKDEPV